MTRATSSDEAKARAEARFKKETERAANAKVGRDHAAAAKTAETEKTARLRAMRLAKEETDRLAALAAPPPVKKRKRAASTSNA